MILDQIPGILKKKFEFLGIRKACDLIEKYDEIISMPSFGNKCSDSLIQYVLSIQELPEDFKKKIQALSASPTVEPLKIMPINRFTQTLSGRDEPFFVEIPRILEEKFKALNIYSPNDLITKHDELTSYRSFGKKCAIALDDFLTSCCDFFDRINDNETPIESDISNKYLTIFADFLSSHDPRFTVIFERRVLNQSASLDDIASIYEISRERIRQVESSFYKISKSLLLGKSSSKSIVPDIQLVNAFTQITKFVSENEIVGEFQVKTFASKFQRDGFTDQQWNHMKAAFKLIDIPVFSISLPGFSQIIYTTSELNPEKLSAIAKSIISVLQERIKPVDRISLIIEVKKHLGRNISNDVISKTAEILECVDVNGQFFQMKLRYFTSASDMAVAVLDRHKSPLHFNEIFREINHTLIRQGGTPYEGNTSGAITKNPK